MDTDQIRAFIAVDIGPEIRGRLVETQSVLKRADADVRWVAPDNTHLTLVFFRHISTEHALMVADSLDRIGSETAEFSIEVAGAGFFGSKRFPRVIWAGVRPAPAMSKLQASVCAELKAWKIPFDDKPFKPHLTLGRVRSPRGAPGLIKALEPFQERHFGIVRVTAMLLIKSTLTSAGPEYEYLRKAALTSSTP